MRWMAGGLSLALLVGVARAEPLERERGPLALSIEDALAEAVGSSELVTIARGALDRARAEQTQARSQWFPQIAGGATYDRTLKTQFDEFFAPENVGVQPGTDMGAGLLEPDVLPFGRTNNYTLSLYVNQNLFTGGRIAANRKRAAAARRTADLGVTVAHAETILEVVTAYYDSVLAARLLDIARAQLAQAEDTLQQTKLRFAAGTAPEFDVLRAQVQVQNQQPVVLQRQLERELALLRLRQRLDLPPEQPLTLTTELQDDREAEPAGVGRLAREAAGLPAAEESAPRVPVLQASEAVTLSQATTDAARAQRWPILSANTYYSRVAYPEDLWPGWSEFLTNWTIGLRLDVPIFTGFRISGQVAAARADLAQARARLELTRELASLDAQSAEQQLSTARARWASARGTVEQAERAHEIAGVRYQEGVSTQLELADARLQLAEARANRAQATRDLLVARTRLALLPALPLPDTAAPILQTGSAVTAVSATQGAYDPGALGTELPSASGVAAQPTVPGLGPGQINRPNLTGVGSAPTGTTGF